MMRCPLRRSIFNWFWRYFTMMSVLLLAPQLSAMAGEDAGAKTVNCYDPGSDVVETRYAGQCQGKVVDDAEADRLRQARSDRIRRAMMVVKPPVDAGLRMTGIGTGFFITRNSELLTNNHVVAGCVNLTVETTTGITAAAKLIDTNPTDDLALLRAETPPPATVVFRNAVDFADQPVVVIGYPDRGMPPVKPFMVEGDLTGPAVMNGRKFAFHADIRPGNSGGPLLDNQGLVVGVVFAKVDSVKVYQATGNLVREVGYAITDNAVMEFLAQNHISVEMAREATAMNSAELFDKARPFIARIGCWK